MEIYDQCFILSLYLKFTHYYKLSYISIYIHMELFKQVFVSEEHINFYDMSTWKLIDT